MGTEDRNNSGQMYLGQDRRPQSDKHKVLYIVSLQRPQWKKWESAGEKDHFQNYATYVCDEKNSLYDQKKEKDP